jgi:hypothetical protein
MTTIMDIERALKRMELRLSPSLPPQPGDLLVHHTVARELGFRPYVLGEILTAGLGPEPRPVFDNGCYWFKHGQVADFWNWFVTEASDEECGDIAGFILRNDPAIKLVTPGDDAREFVLWALWEVRQGKGVSERFRLVLDA